MYSAIMQALAQIEMQHQIKILYACEAGSRAWGIERQDSDYDVRFIYVRPKDDYLHLDTPGDFIEVPVVGDLDISGWDICKALRLLRKTNLSLLEWLFSSTIYFENSQTIADIRHIARSPMASRVPLYHHYSRMASSNYHQFIREKDSVRAKKYLYVIRPLIMLLYLEQHNGAMPLTINFAETLANIELADEVRMHIDEIVAR